MLDPSGASGSSMSPRTSRAYLGQAPELYFHKLVFLRAELPVV